MLEFALFYNTIPRLTGKNFVVSLEKNDFGPILFHPSRDSPQTRLLVDGSTVYVPSAPQEERFQALSPQSPRDTWSTDRQSTCRHDSPVPPPSPDIITVSTHFLAEHVGGIGRGWKQARSNPSLRVRGQNDVAAKRVQRPQPNGVPSTPRSKGLPSVKKTRRYRSARKG